jgi:WhiB family redox-sensing transcriptional regulator
MRIKSPSDFENAKCSSFDVNLFYEKDFDDLDSKIINGNYQEAKKICMSCEHIVECAEWGINNETHGMWGGLTPRERQKLRKISNIKVTNPTLS